MVKERGKFSTYGFYRRSNRVPQMHTLICLMARGVHRGGVNRPHYPTGTDKILAHKTVHEELNREAHGNDHAHHIPVDEVSRMIDKIQDEHRGIFGIAGYVERATPNRMTRGLRMIWNRATRTVYHGDLVGMESEMTRWREAREETNRFASAFNQRKCTLPIYVLAISPD
jgi:hypothetical protein